MHAGMAARRAKRAYDCPRGLRLDYGAHERKGARRHMRMESAGICPADTSHEAGRFQTRTKLVEARGDLNGLALAFPGPAAAARGLMCGIAGAYAFDGELPPRVLEALSQIPAALR